MADWYKTAYRRGLVDMHIDDWNEEFLSRYDPKEYVELLAAANVSSAVIYAQSHVGLSFYPTKVGKMHRGLKGRNVLAEAIDGCRARNIPVVVYFSLIYDCWAYDNNPDWRIRFANGKGAADEGSNNRYGVCCPNSPYRDYAIRHTQEICREFEFEGIRFDMTFWPAVCYCDHCRRKFRDATAKELPSTIDWFDPHWVSFQRAREAWMLDFASTITQAVREIKPGASVEHQASTLPMNWSTGVTERLVNSNDFLEGDFYGDNVQGSFVRKLMYNLSPNRPIAFETARCVFLNNHTASKSRELVEAKAFSCLADGAAYVFIDAIDPVGTFNPEPYKMIASVFAKTKPYEKYLGGDLCQDAVVYLSSESKCDFAYNGTDIGAPTVRTNQVSTSVPHVDACLSVCRSLVAANIPFGVIGRRNLPYLRPGQVLVLPNVLMMDDEEVESIREFVRQGGSVYASKGTSLVTSDGTKHEDFLLGDVFGVSWNGETEHGYTYLAPVDGREVLFPGYSAKNPLAIEARQMRIEARPGVEVLATLTLPYTDRGKTTRFASIHSDPPGFETGKPAIVLNRFGAGTAIYSAADLERIDLHRETFANLIKRLGGSWSFETDAPKCVEVTLFNQPDKNRFIVSLVNFQKELPNIPIENIAVGVNLRGRSVSRLIAVPSETDAPFSVENGYVQFVAPRLETFAMFVLEYRV